MVRLLAPKARAPPETVKPLETVKLVMVVVAKVDVPVTPKVPEKDGELVTLIVPEEVEVETVMLVPAKIL
jgi:hypothetical protein